MRYKVTFTMQSPIIAYEPILFDSLILYLFIKKYNGFVPQTLIIEDKDIIKLPESIITKDVKGYYRASIMMTDNDYLSDVTNFTKRWHRKDEDLIGNKKLKILTQKSIYKSFMLPYESKNYDKVYFVFESEDIETVKLLLNELSSIGKKRHRGYGLIASYLIEESEDNILRPIPSDDGDIFMTLTPPYWRVNNIIEQKLTMI